VIYQTDLENGTERNPVLFRLREEVQQI
jgi:hypothetical protein